MMPRWLVFLPLYFSVALFVAIPCLERVAATQQRKENDRDWDSKGRERKPLLYIYTVTVYLVISCDHHVDYSGRSGFFLRAWWML